MLGEIMTKKDDTELKKKPKGNKILTYVKKYRAMEQNIELFIYWLRFHIHSLKPHLIIIYLAVTI
jgi:hypothetical protein